MTNDPLTPAQHEVQRLLGKCLLRLQQLERDYKTLYVHFSLSASIGQDVGKLHAERRQQVAKLTLGQTTDKLLKAFMTKENEDCTDHAEPEDPQSLAIAYRHRISMPPEQRDRTLAEIDELIEMRNQLVHQFIAQYDLWSVEGCLEAKPYLQACYDRIAAQHDQLRDWLKNMAATQDMFRQFIESETFQAFFIEGTPPKNQELTFIRNELPMTLTLTASFTMPDDSQDWASSRIVHKLREATYHHAEPDGWTSLETARFWLAQHAPDETPTKYGCQSWKQLVHESGQFELQHRRNEQGAGSRWFKIRPT